MQSSNPSFILNFKFYSCKASFHVNGRSEHDKFTQMHYRSILDGCFVCNHKEKLLLTLSSKVSPGHKKEFYMSY